MNGISHKSGDGITSLPIFSLLDEIAGVLRERRTLMLTAEPGAGKTTLVPWKLMQDHGTGSGKILLLQPRRVAARAAAERIAQILGEKLGATVGLRTRLETVVSASTRLEVVTEGVLVRIIQHDQALEGYDTVIFDEFHERNLAGDLALAFTHDCRQTLRPDLALLFMSATVRSTELAPVLGDVPRIAVPGRTFLVTVEYHPPLPNEKPWEGAARLVRKALGLADTGDILVFLPGYREITRARELLEKDLPGNCAILALHGSLPPSEQRRAFQPVKNVRRIILSTNIAETSVTIPGITVVVDTGLERRVRFSPRTGMDHWDTGAISAASAEQRKGRAGRLGPGICLRWWREDAPLLPHSQPEILEADLAPLALETAAWGAKTAEDLAWLTPPPQAHLRRAMALLADLGLVEGNGAISPQGRAASALGLHPRLARMVLRAALEGDVATAALVAALIEEGGGIARGAADFRDRIEQWIAWSRSAPGDSSIALNRVRDEAARCARAADSSFNAKDVDPSIAGRLLLLAYPDRAAKRSGVQGNRTRWTLAGGRAAFSSVPFSGCEYIVAPEIDGGDTDGRIMLAAPVDEKDIIRAFKESLEETVSVSWKGWKPVFEAEFRAGGMLIDRGRRAVPEAGIIQREALRRLSDLGLQSLPWSDESRALLARCRLARKKGMSSDFPDFLETALLDEAGTWLVPFGRWDGGVVWDDASILKALKSRLGYALAARLDIWAPEWVLLPSGSRRRVEYESGEFPVIAARLQEFFGRSDTPIIAGEPALLHLLSPAGRPVQVTRDLGGFWSGSYRDVRKELLGRYPRHYWPENPMEAEPTSRAKPRKK